MNFDAKITTEKMVNWIRKWFDENGKGCKAVVGISGGKDSSIVATLCASALGKDEVVGVLMPHDIQHDIDVAKRLVDYLNIRHMTVNIKGAYNSIVEQVDQHLAGITSQTKINLPARLRMSTLYAVSQTVNGRVANTCNLSEDWVGYATRYGDSVGDFSPLSKLTVTEVKEIGRFLGLPAEFVEKIPIDGLCGKTDEDNLGFSYAMLDKYIRTGVCEDATIKSKIDNMHEKFKFKLELMPVFEPELE